MLENFRYSSLTRASRFCDSYSSNKYGALSMTLYNMLKLCPIPSLFQAPRWSGPLYWESANTKIKREETGERGGGGACNHFFKRPVPVYQLLVYPLIGQIWQIISTLSKRVVSVTQRDGVRRPRAWNRGIHDNFCVERMFTRFPAHGSAEEGTEDLPCELGAWKRCFYNPADRLRSCLITK